MVKEYHLSSDEEKRLLLKSQSAIFDKHLESLLSKIEESWFGSKKFLLLGDASYQPKVDGYPIILVLGYEVQMLPWESLPLLKDQEVYRMPSISSIHVVVDKCNIQKEQAERSLKSFQLIDPLHGFYILNPDGTLNIFQKVFEKYFIKKELKGKVNYEPTLKELTSVLENHNIFLYFGHGSGKQYIPDRVIKKLKECSAAILMGCRSGSLTLQGIYAPLGTPLSYLMAGSPFIVANLWDLLESEACLLGKTLFEESDSSNSYGHIRRIGDFVAKARNGCNRPFLTGAALVCYGVPVGIHRHEDILE